MYSKKSWSVQKIIAAVLLLVSFVMLFLPWMSISVNAMGQKITIGKALDYAAMAEYISREELLSDMHENLMDLSEDLADEGIRLNANSAMRTIRLILDSKISPLEAARILSFASGLLGQFNRYTSRNSSSYGAEGIAASMLKEYSGKVTFAAVMMWVLLALALIALAVTVLMMFMDNRFAGIPYASVSLILLILFAVVVGSVNNALSGYSRSIVDLLEEIDLGYIPASDIKLFHLYFPAVLSLIFALAAMVLLLFGAGGKALAGMPARKIGAAVPVDKLKSFIPEFGAKISGGWTCSACGAKMGSGTAFCSACGTKRPEPPRCSACGKELPKGVAFCPYCGTRAAAPAAAPKSAPGTKLCPSCGASVRAEFRACPSCGHMFGAAPAADPAPAYAPPAARAPMAPSPAPSAEPVPERTQAASRLMGSMGRPSDDDLD